MEPDATINFDSNIPYYIQLVKLLNDQITDQKWKPGQQIPGEQELCSLYNVSRTVVRQALGELERSGLISRKKGKGTFVSEPKVEEGLMQNLTGFHQEMAAKGVNTITKVLHHAVTKANSKVAEYLGIPEGTKVIDIQRLFCRLKTEPFCNHISRTIYVLNWPMPILKIAPFMNFWRKNAGFISPAAGVMWKLSLRQKRKHCFESNAVRRCFR